MADNFAFTPGVGASGAADDIDGVLYPRVKVALGANNTNDGDISSSNPMPVTGTITAVTAITNALPAGTNAIGKLAANSGVDIGDVDVTSSALPTGASTAANQSTIIGHVDGIETLLGTIDADTSRIPALGQALAAASVPVVLPEAQITTLTPPAAITGFATSAKQDTIIGAVDGVEALLTTIDEDTSKIPALGQAAMAASVPVALASNQSSIPVAATLGAETTKVIGTVNIAASQSVQLAAGTAAIGKLAANSGVDIGDVDILSIAAGTNAIGNVGIVPRTSGGLSMFRSIDIDESEEDVKTSAGQVFGYYIFNAAATTHYVKFYNATAANVTVGTTTPVLTLPIPAGAAANLMSETGIAFGTAISVAATTGVADNDTGAPAANAVVINVFYA